MDKILEALKKLLPASDVTEVAQAVEAFLTEARTELESEFNTKLEEAYKELASELKDAEKVAEEGYSQAYGVITDLRNRMDTMREEYEAALEEGYEQAYQMILSERTKAQTLETDLYEQYDKKLMEMKSYIVEKVHQFLQHKGTEIYEQARRDVLADPRMAEHKVALDRIVDITANYLGTEDRVVATSSKLSEATRTIDELKGQIKLLESRSIRLSMENTKLTESAKRSDAKAKAVVNESVKADKNERLKNAKNVTGKGRIVENEQVEVIKEHKAQTTNDTTADDATTLSESVGGVDVATLATLAGVQKTK